jgi:uncharacterized protein (DUF849 family)
MATTRTKVVLEARINEYAMRDRNLHVSWTADEIAETAARCREEGAAILHFQARAEDGTPLHTPELYAREFHHAGVAPQLVCWGLASCGAPQR